jgi:prepilin-type processing-associated H-X9-DG protein
MTEIDNKIQEPNHKISIWAKISFWCGLFALGFPILLFSSSMAIMMLWTFCPLFRKVGDFLESFLFIIPYSLVVIALFAIISGIGALIVIRLNKATLKGVKKAVTGIILGLSFFLLLFGMRQLAVIRELAVKYGCQNSMSEIGKALRQYAAENDNKYPTDYEWCDLLIEHCGLKERIFWCNSAYEHRLNYKNSNYALNPNVEPNSPPNLVLLCETKGGWNQVADPNLLTAENHVNGCNILFNDGHAEFVKKKNFKNLKWKTDNK